MREVAGSNPVVPTISINYTVRLPPSAAVLHIEMDFLDPPSDLSSSGGKCTVQQNVIKCVNSLCLDLRKKGGAHYYNLSCLSLLIEAVTLYDKIVVYNVEPESFPFDGLTGPVGAALTEIGCIEVYDQYSKLSVEERIKAWLSYSFHTSEFGAKKTIFSTKLAGCPEDILIRNEQLLENLDLKAIQQSLVSVGAANLPSRLRSHDLNRFYRLYLGTKIWEIETTREIRELTQASGMIVRPCWIPFWEREIRNISSALHTKFKELENAVLAKHLGENINIDFSPLTAVLLDSTLTPERLPETIIQIRRDYSELREIGNSYSSLLRSASTYAEVSEAVNQWKAAWEAVLKRMIRPEKPLINRLLGWDVIKKGTLKGMLLEATDIVGKEWKHIGMVKGLTMALKFEQEFLFARRIEGRVKDLFGGVDYSQVEVGAPL